MYMLRRRGRQILWDCRIPIASLVTAGFFGSKNVILQDHTNHPPISRCSGVTRIVSRGRSGLNLPLNAMRRGSQCKAAADSDSGLRLRQLSHNASFHQLSPARSSSGFGPSARSLTYPVATCSPRCWMRRSRRRLDRTPSTTHLGRTPRQPLHTSAGGHHAAQNP